jgi:hypothetical protein
MPGLSGKEFQDIYGGAQWGAKTAGQDWLQQYRQMLGAQGQVSPFYSNLMQNGLPFYRQMTDYNQGNIAQAYAPARAAALRSMSTQSNLPSGYRQAVMNSLNSQQARDFDSSLNQAMMANQMAKMQGAAGLQGQQQLAGNQAMGWAGLEEQPNEAFIGAPQRPTGGQIAGGIAQAGLTAASAF